MKSQFIITYYGTGTAPTQKGLPEGTTEEEAIAIAKEYKADPYRGFASLEEVRRIEV